MRVRLRRADSRTDAADLDMPAQPQPQGTAATDADSFEIGGLRISGLKLQSFEGGDLRIVVPLKAGKFSFPGIRENVDAVIAQNCTAFISLEVGKGADGLLKITHASLDFSEGVVITNPASAFLDSGTGRFSETVNALRDRFAKIKLTGVEVDAQGKLTLDGSLIKAGFKRCPLSEVIEVPALNLGLAELFDRAKSKTDNGGKVQELLKAFGQVFGEASYEAHLTLSPTVLSMRNNSFDFLSEKRGATAQIKGKFSLSEALDFSFTADPKSSFVDSLLGKMTLDAAVDILHPLDEEAHLNFKLDGHIEDLPKLSVTGNHLYADAAHFSARGEADINFKARSAKNGTAIIACSIDRPTVEIENVGAEVRGAVGATLTIRDFTLHHAHKTPAFIGRVSAFIGDDRVRQAEINFRVHKSGRLSTSPLDNPVSHLIDLPFGDYPRSRLRRVDLPHGLGRLTNRAFREEIATLTNSRIADNNHVELLVDGPSSYPRRMQLIREAKESICLQTLVFQDDETGIAMATALAEAAQRGVKVRVIVDGQGAADNLRNVFAENQAFKIMLKAGVDLRIHNDSAINGLKDIIDVLIDNKLTHYSKEQLVRSPITTLAAVICGAALRLQNGYLRLDETQKRKFIAGINKGLGRELNAPIDAKHPVLPTNSNGAIQIGAFMDRAQAIIGQVYSWHEKHFIVDGQVGIWGGMNIARPYMSGEWRDTDVLIQGPAVDDGADAFNKNWHHLTGERLHLPRYNKDEQLIKSVSDASVQIIQHSPSINGDNHITDFLTANLNRLLPGESAYFENAYFCTSTTLSPLYDAMMSAAKRGVKVVLLTNSEVSSDLPAINRAAFHTYRDLLKAGVRIFERKDRRTIHSKIAVLGADIAIVGSANLDNRSARVNSEVIAVVYDENFANTLRDVIKRDLDENIAREITREDLAAIPPMKSAHFVAMSMLRDMC